MNPSSAASSCRLSLADEAEGAVRLAAVVDVDRVGADAHEAGKVAADRRRSRTVAERAAGERAVVSCRRSGWCRATDAS